jgi:hypothetical protein
MREAPASCRWAEGQSWDHVDQDFAGEIAGRRWEISAAPQRVGEIAQEALVPQLSVMIGGSCGPHVLLRTARKRSASTASGVSRPSASYWRSHRRRRYPDLALDPPWATTTPNRATGSQAVSLIVGRRRHSTSTRRRARCR